MNAACCVVPRTRSRARRWFGAGGGVGPAVMLALLPKCPACVAAYLAVWTGAGLAAPIAEYLRPVLAVIFVASVIYLIVTGVADRRRRLNVS